MPGNEAEQTPSKGLRPTAAGKREAADVAEARSFAPPGEQRAGAESVGPDLVSVEDRMAAGAALRHRAPHADHSRWEEGADRIDPIETLRAADRDRLPELVPIRYGRMLASPFAFYRGAAGIMAADLSKTPASGIRVQCCGDCHLLNFGGFATPERNILFDINDFDETSPGPWEWDVKRLAASFVLAGRSLGLSDAKARDAAVTCVHAYRKQMAEFSAMDPLSVWYARTTEADFVAGLSKSTQARIRKRVAKAVKRGPGAEFPKLAGMVGGRLGIHEARPLIFHPDSTRTEEFRADLARVLAEYRATLGDDVRFLLDRYTLIDVAIKVVGVGSVGRRCWIALMMSASNAPLFLQIKEAVESVLEPFAGESAYRHHGQRVVMGQRLMQPASDLFLGWVTASLTGKQFYVRQLRDAKIKPLVEAMDQEMLCFYGMRCGATLARAHAKAGDAALISGYLGAGDSFDGAVGDFSVAYADQAESDHAALKAAVRRGRVCVELDA
jgi:uncharacterized protein (DUF2252 family)